MQTRFAFLGLVIGTIPLFYKEVKKEGFSKKYYILIAISAIAGLLLFSLNKGAFPQIENPNLIQSITLGVAVAGSSIIPSWRRSMAIFTIAVPVRLPLRVWRNQCRNYSPL